MKRDIHTSRCWISWTTAFTSRYQLLMGLLPMGRLLAEPDDIYRVFPITKQLLHIIHVPGNFKKLSWRIQKRKQLQNGIIKAEDGIIYFPIMESLEKAKHVYLNCPFQGHCTLPLVWPSVCPKETPIRDECTLHCNKIFSDSHVLDLSTISRTWLVLPWRSSSSYTSTSSFIQNGRQAWSARAFQYIVSQMQSQRVCPEIPVQTVTAVCLVA